jgi:hypothetical protein
VLSAEKKRDALPVVPIEDENRSKVVPPVWIENGFFKRSPGGDARDRQTAGNDNGKKMEIGLRRRIGPCFR